jgi:hypothetical protein
LFLPQEDGNIIEMKYPRIVVGNYKNYDEYKSLLPSCEIPGCTNRRKFQYEFPVCTIHFNQHTKGYINLNIELNKGLEFQTLPNSLLEICTNKCTINHCFNKRLNKQVICNEHLIKYTEYLIKNKNSTKIQKNFNDYFHRCHECKEYVIKLDYKKVFGKFYLCKLHQADKPLLKKLANNIKARLRRDNYIQFKLAHNLRSRLYMAIKRKQKAGSAVKDLGCTVEELQWWLQFWWQPGMNWKNYGRKGGQWSIDHIIPLSKVDLTNREQFLSVCNYKNLQPMWHIENIAFGNKNKYDSGIGAIYYAET